LIVEILKSDQIRVASLGALLQIAGKSGSGETDETRSGCVELCVSGQQIADPAQALEVAKSHLLVPLSLADGQERRPAAVGMAQNGDVD